MSRTILLVVAHPRTESFNYSIAARVAEYAKQNDCTLVTHDLYADGFNPVLTSEESLMVQHSNLVGVDPLVQQYQRQLQSANILVVVHPNWWGKPPAIMAGWLDRVLAPGVAYKLSNGAAGMPQPALQIKSLVITTGDTPLEREREVFGDPLDAIWNNCVLSYIGSTTYKRLHLSPVSSSTPEERESWLDTVSTALQQLDK